MNANQGEPSIEDVEDVESNLWCGNWRRVRYALSMKGFVPYAAAFVALLLGLASAGCPAKQEGFRGCRFDDECGQAEVCSADGSCTSQETPDPRPLDAGVAPTVDGGHRVDAGLVVPQDGGAALDAGASDGGARDAGVVLDGGAPVCIADGLDNGSAATAWDPGVPLTESAVDGRICPGQEAFFRFHAFNPDRAQMVMSWEGDIDIDLDHVEVDALVGLSVSKEAETASLDITQSADVTVRAYAFHAEQIPAAGASYRFQVRSGRACDIDADCNPVAGEACLMPLWPPNQSAQGIRGTRGICAPPWTPCAPGLADSVTAEGISDQRSNAITQLPQAGAFSCQHDVDWYQYDVTQNGDVRVTLTNLATLPATYLVALYDDGGQLLGGEGFENVGLNVAVTMMVPVVQAGTHTFLRIFQLSDDDLALYGLSVDTRPVSCALSSECLALEPETYGRVECTSGACVCPTTGCSL